MLEPIFRAQRVGFAATGEADPRFVLTALQRREAGAQPPKNASIADGRENCIKKCQIDLFAGSYVGETKYCSTEPAV